MASDNIYVYWTRKADADRSGSGWCLLEKVPEDGEVLSESIPTSLNIETDANGTLTVTSPPIIGSHKAYRYHLSLSAEQRSKINNSNDTWPGLMPGQYLYTQYTEAPRPGSTRENWWSYAKNDFRYASTARRAIKTPVGLMKKWKRPMLEIILANHPDKERHLTEWDNRVSSHDARVVRNRIKRTNAHRKQHNDLVVLPYPMFFSKVVDDEVHYEAHQVFRYEVTPPSYRERAKHRLTVGGIGYKTPHGPAMTFFEGVAPCSGLSPAIRAILPLLAWSETPMETAHQVIAAETKFGSTCRQTKTELQAFIGSATENELQQFGIANFDAAIRALQDFRPIATPTDTAHTSAASKGLNDKIDETLSLLMTGKQTLFLS